jgi:ribosomal protein L11 methyltransferase
MQWTEAKVIFDFHDKELAAELISDVFYGIGVTGLVIESPDAEPTEDDWADGVQQTPEHHAVIAYFPKNDLIEERCRALENKLINLEQTQGVVSRILYREMDEEDWSESWKEFFWPEKISRNIVVKPTWREYSPAENEIVLEIDPGMAFGTGTHPTTALCIRMIEKYLKPGASFFDVGTGSGILMVAAAKLGATYLLGTDKDEVAVEIAEKNLLLNNINPEKFRVMTAHLTSGVTEKFDMVAANILSQVIVILLDDVKNILAQDGIFICSGIVEENRDTVTEKMRALSFELLEIQSEQGWVAIAGKRKTGDR